MSGAVYFIDLPYLLFAVGTCPVLYISFIYLFIIYPVCIELFQPPGSYEFTSNTLLSDSAD